MGRNWLGLGSGRGGHLPPQGGHSLARHPAALLADAALRRAPRRTRLPAGSQWRPRRPPASRLHGSTAPAHISYLGALVSCDRPRCPERGRGVGPGYSWISSFPGLGWGVDVSTCWLDGCRDGGGLAACRRARESTHPESHGCGWMWICGRRITGTHPLSQGRDYS